MKQLAQYQNGRLELQDVPDPVAPPGGILVRTAFSVISPGTEKMKVEQAKMSLLAKARARPDQVKKVLTTAKTLGWRTALEKVKNRLEIPTPLGYSASGIVIDVDSNNNRFKVGDRVACGGAECAFHAEILSIPDMLAAPIPDSVSLENAAFTTLSSISMHAIRQSELQVGEYVMVLGLGVVGQLCANLINIAGARALGVDFISNRLNTALQMGAEKVANPKDNKIEDIVYEWTEGRGVDSVFLCLGGDNPQPLQLAVSCLRDRGKLVLVGIYNAALDWKTCYAKEIEVRYSRSYGPGRYDPEYEWGGQDYPIGYVRWTEARNFDSCLELMRSKRLLLDPLITRAAKFVEATDVYSELLNPNNSDIGILLKYQCELKSDFPSIHNDVVKNEISSELKLSTPIQAVDVIGAGNFARTMLLPNIKEELKFGTVVNNTGLSAQHVKTKFNFQSSSANSNDILDSGTGNAIIIATRHNLHASLVIQALQKNRHVFVEKPLCLNREELNEIDKAKKSSTASVMVGYNRRFAPATKFLVELLNKVSGPKVITYNVFSGRLEPGHWYSNIEESGGRVVGEACHFLDYFCYILNARPRRVFAQNIWPLKTSNSYSDSVSAQIEFNEGSSAQLIYTTEGDYAFPKETFRIFAAGLVIECENFQKLNVYRDNKKSTHQFSSKGHKEEMLAWSKFLKGQGSFPIPYEESYNSTLLSFALLDSIRLKSQVNFM